MIRVTKPEGFGNIVLEEVPIPPVGLNEVRVRSKVSLISRGSEILRRYMHEEAIDPRIMGYSLAGVVDAVGERGGGALPAGGPGDGVGRRMRSMWCSRSTRRSGRGFGLCRTTFRLRRLLFCRWRRAGSRGRRRRGSGPVIRS